MEDAGFFLCALSPCRDRALKGGPTLLVFSCKRYRMLCRGLLKCLVRCTLLNRTYSYLRPRLKLVEKSRPFIV